MTAKVTRDQLAKVFGNDARLIRQFELLSSQSVSTPVELQDIALSADAAAARASRALGNGADYVDFHTGISHAMQPGRAAWNPDDGTLDVGLYGGSVLQTGQETMFYAKNTSGATITNGTPCMFTGTVGASGKLTFGKAVADGSFPAEYMMGVATQDIPNNEFGYVTAFGLVRGFNTSGSPYGESWADGDLLYFGTDSAGSWTKTRPTAPAIKAPVAVVVNAASGGSGSIFVRMRTDSALGALHDVHAPSPANGHVLIYDAVQGRWESATISAGSNITITNSAGGVSIATSGASGEFTTTDGKTVTVINGIITSIV